MNFFTLFAVLGPYLSSLLNPDVWAVITHGLPVITRLVKSFEDTEGLTGREKAAKVFDEARALLAEDGVVINEKFDSVLYFCIELALIFVRQPAPTEKADSVTITKPKAAKAPTGGHH